MMNCTSQISASGACHSGSFHTTVCQDVHRQCCHISGKSEKAFKPYETHSKSDEQGTEGTETKKPCFFIFKAVGHDDVMTASQLLHIATKTISTVYILKCPNTMSELRLILSLCKAHLILVPIVFVLSFPLNRQ